MSEELIKKILEEIKDIKTNMATKQDIEKNDTKIDSISKQIASNTEQIKMLTDEQQQIKQAVMETNGNMKQLTTIQDSQQRIIELLSARSLKQESELRDLKRVK